MQNSAVIEKSRDGTRGSVITECVMTIPVLLIIITGLTQLGYTFSQINWTANASYEVALAGGGSPESVLELATQGRYQQIKDLSYYRVNLPTQPVKNVNTTFISGAIPPRSLEVKINASVPSLMSYISPAFNVHAVAPLLVAGNGDAGVLSQFQNADLYYDCNGMPLPAGDPPCSSCNPMSCP